MTEEEYEKIDKEAYKLFIRANSGVRGQIITKENFLEYWTAKVAYEKGLEIGKNSSNSS